MILDTNALSAAADGEPAALEVIARAERLAIPVVVLGEYRMGIAQSRHKSTYETWLRGLISTVNVLPIEDETAGCYAAIGLDLKKKGKPIPANDLWIAALCRQHSLPLLSRDRHFDFVPGLRRIDW
ncbi:MAG: type II toxin-antitoxin system VapC family toxin [Acidobacteria bacterium]|nr:type II toxin-antitoxin system VapC family toxin [Acidobacteriota bacterium]MBS1866384.1 type II toxin-antitoxin system VapC family toxin [Acidobacteriota bacterium]